MILAEIAIFSTVQMKKNYVQHSKIMILDNLKWLYLRKMKRYDILCSLSMIIS